MEPKTTLTPMSNTEMLSLFNILGSKQSSFRFIAQPVSILVLSALERLNTFEEDPKSSQPSRVARPRRLQLHQPQRRHPGREPWKTVPSGTPLTVTLADAISTETNKEGNTFTAHLTDPAIGDC